MSVDEFLATADSRDGRWELENGGLIAMAPERLQHGRVKGDMFLALREGIRRANLSCEAVTDSVAVRISARTTYIPDALVYCGPRLPPNTLEINEPTIVVEVLSPTTASRDHGPKLLGYLSLPSLAHYLIVTPEHRHIVHYWRDADSVWRIGAATGNTLRLDPPGFDLVLVEVFPEE